MGSVFAVSDGGYQVYHPAYYGLLSLGTLKPSITHVRVSAHASPGIDNKEVYEFAAAVGFGPGTALNFFQALNVSSDGPKFYAAKAEFEPLDGARDSSGELPNMANVATWEMRWDVRASFMR